MSHPLHLINVADDQRPQAILEGIVRLYRAVFPDRLRAVYLLGSRNDGSAASISDLDGLVLFKGNFRSEDERERARRMFAACRLISPIRLDFWIMAEEHETFLELQHDARLHGGRLIYGEDTRDRIPLPSLADYRRWVVRWPERFIPLLHDVKTPVYPLDYPDPADEFFGYVKVREPSWYPHATRQGTKELVATLFWITTALLAFEAGQLTIDRTETLHKAREHLDDDRTSFLEEVYFKCKSEWDYRVPDDPAERAVLRRLCEKTLPFCNRYLEGMRHSKADSSPRVTG